MVQIEERWVPMSDGQKLYAKIWIPDSSSTAKALLVFVHGFSDHISAYYDLFPTLSSPPYNILVYGFDQRGWGRSVTSPAQAGLTGSSVQVIQDLYDYISHAHRAHPDLPLFLMGHSMGGQEALQYVLSTPPRELIHGPPLPRISGLLCESPYIALDPSSQPSGFTVFAGRLASKLMPKKQLLQKLDSTYMSRDSKVRQDWVDDKLCHDTGTLEGLAGMLDRAAQLADLGTGKTVPGLQPKPGCPVWIGHGTEDGVTSFDASKKLFDVLDETDKTFRTYDGAYHKLHAEPGGVGDDFASDVGKWIVERISSSAGAVQNEDVRAKL